MSRSVLALFAAALRISLGRIAGGPRLGAVDVVPFIPIRNIDTAACVALAREAGAAIAERFSVPVYLYEDAATSEERRNLSNIRKG